MRKELAEYGDLISVQLFSAHNGDGLQALRSQLDQWLDIPRLDEAGIDELAAPNSEI